MSDQWTVAALTFMFERITQKFGSYEKWSLTEGSNPVLAPLPKGQLGYEEFCKILALAIPCSVRSLKLRIRWALLEDSKPELGNVSAYKTRTRTAALEAGFIRSRHFLELEARKFQPTNITQPPKAVSSQALPKVSKSSTVPGKGIVSLPVEDWPLRRLQ